MCGIAGFLSTNVAPDERAIAVARMNAAMLHRGPDDGGVGTWGPATLGMRRLAIFDPANGRQPMSTPDGRWHIVFNGAIYNFRELRAQLEAKGHVIRTQCDTEALARQRQAEAQAALGELGVDSAEITFLGTGDGTLARLEAGEAGALVTALAAVIERVRPDEVLLPDRNDGSSEHEAVFRFFQAALAATTGLTPRVLEFPVWAWWSPRLLARLVVARGRVWRCELGGHLAAKRRAVAAHRSQVEPAPPWPRAVLAPEFIAFFLGPVEYCFER